MADPILAESVVPVAEEGNKLVALVCVPMELLGSPVVELTSPVVVPHSIPQEVVERSIPEEEVVGIPILAAVGKHIPMALVAQHC